MRRRWFMDTEFDENGSTIRLISIALVSEDGFSELYFCAKDGWEEGDCNDWVRANVVPKLPPEEDRFFRSAIRGHVERILLRDGKPEIWGYFADYDWVVFCQLFGRMVDLPKGMPMYCRDLKQLMDEQGIKRDHLPKQDEAGAHDALEDARWIRDAWLAIQAGGKP